MRFLRVLTLYACCLSGANADTGALIAMAQGELSKIQFAERAVPDVAFDDGTSLAAYRGAPVLLNFWALWCAPCREEMPALNDLAKAVPGVQVLTVATGRNSATRVDAYFTEEGFDALPKLYDRKSDLAQGFAISGLPVTVLIDADGREVGRVAGILDWHSPEAIAFFEHWAALSN